MIGDPNSNRARESHGRTGKTPCSERIASAPLGAAAAAPLVHLDTGQPPFGPAPAPLSGAELPSFSYRLGTMTAQTFDGGSAKEANVEGFPVSDKLAGVYMTLEPGALRELHWHANAAEWAYVIEGRCRVTTIDPLGLSEIADFGPGDVWYFPRGHGHSIQGIGPGTCTFILVFDNGYFSEFGTFSITDWLGHAPADVLARNFGLRAASFADFPKSEVYIATGQRPAGLAARSSAWLAQPGSAHPSLPVAGPGAGEICRRHHARCVGA